MNNVLIAQTDFDNGAVPCDVCKELKLYVTEICTQCEDAAHTTWDYVSSSDSSELVFTYCHICTDCLLTLAQDSISRRINGPQL